MIEQACSDGAAKQRNQTSAGDHLWDISNGVFSLLYGLQCLRSERCCDETSAKKRGGYGSL